MSEEDPPDWYKLLMVPVREVRALSRGIPQEGVADGRFEVVADVPPGMTAETVRSAVTAALAETGAAVAGDRAVSAEAGIASTAIAGLPVKVEPRGPMSPLIAVAMIKGLTGDGRVAHWRVATEDVTTVDAVGMHEAAAHLYKEVLPGKERG